MQREQGAMPLYGESVLEKMGQRVSANDRPSNKVVCRNKTEMLWEIWSFSEVRNGWLRERVVMERMAEYVQTIRRNPYVYQHTLYTSTSAFNAAPWNMLP